MRGMALSRKLSERKESKKRRSCQAGLDMITAALDRVVDRFRNARIKSRSVSTQLAYIDSCLTLEEAVNFESRVLVDNASFL